MKPGGTFSLIGCIGAYKNIIEFGKLQRSLQNLFIIPKNINEIGLKYHRGRTDKV